MGLVEVEELPEEEEGNGKEQGKVYSLSSRSAMVGFKRRRGNEQETYTVIYPTLVSTPNH